MTLFGLIVLLALAAAIAVATMRRQRPESRISEAQRLPPRDDLAGLGLSTVRPAAARGATTGGATASDPTPRAAVPQEVLSAASRARPVSAARPVTRVAAPTSEPPARPVETAARPTETTARPVEATARPAGTAAELPSAPPAQSSAWIDGVLDGSASTDADDVSQDAQRLGVAELDAPAEAVADVPAADVAPEPAPLDAAADGEDDRPAETPEAAPADRADDAVWTFDRDAADETTHAQRPAYIRAGQCLWPDGDAAPALLAASLAARLGGTVAVVRHEGPDYLVELLAGTAAADAQPAPMAAQGHPLHRVPQDGVLSLLSSGAALEYHADPATSVGQVLVRSLAAAPSARVLLVADVPPDAPDVDGATAALVDGYADLLAGLTHFPLVAPDSGAPDDPDAVSDAASDATADLPEAGEGAAPPRGAASEALPGVTSRDEAPGNEALDGSDAGDPGEPEAGAAEPEGGSATTEAAAEPPAEPQPAAGITPASAAHVAQPGARRAAPPPPRGVILAGEIDAARRDRRLLVFALVTVADAETVLRGGADGVVRAEAALRQRLTAASAVRRVEPFGDLLFGVFLDAEGPEVVGWAERVSRQGRPLLVGAVPANGAPDLVRAAATSALQSAYEHEVVCVVAS
ncbi:MAG TPA: hypothetical protein VGB53_08650 [Rubricoccaceae bacterium]